MHLGHFVITGVLGRGTGTRHCIQVVLFHSANY
jgi:hypothetical protein